MSNNDLYKQKYLKYKLKYLEMRGGKKIEESNVTLINNEIEKTPIQNLDMFMIFKKYGHDLGDVSQNIKLIEDKFSADSLRKLLKVVPHLYVNISEGKLIGEIKTDKEKYIKEKNDDKINRSLIKDQDTKVIGIKCDYDVCTDNDVIKVNGIITNHKKLNELNLQHKFHKPKSGKTGFCIDGYEPFSSQKTFICKKN